MTDYQEFGITLTDLQKKNLASSIIKKQPVTLRLSKNQLQGNDKLLLTKRQANRIVKHQKNGKGCDIKFSSAQLKHMAKHGAALPLLALLPALLGGLGGLSGGIAAAVNSAKQTNEMHRHNKEMENIANKATGTGLYLSPYKGSGIKKTKVKKKGDA